MEKVAFHPEVSFYLDGLVVKVIHKEKSINFGPLSTVLEYTIERLMLGVPIEDIHHYIPSKVADILFKEKFLFTFDPRHTKDYTSSDWWGFHYFGSSAFNNNFKRASLLFLGFGSLGPAILQCLPKLRQVVLIDGDVVEASNIARQSFYSIEHNSIKKVEAAKNIIYGLDKAEKVSIYAEKIESSMRLNEILTVESPDLIVLTADMPVWEILEIVSASSRYSGVPVLRVNNLGVGPFYNGKSSPCLYCEYLQLEGMFPFLKKTGYLRNKFVSPYKGVSPATIPIMASAAAKRIMDYIIYRDIPELKGRRQRIYPEGISVDYQTITLGGNCDCRTK